MLGVIVKMRKKGGRKKKSHWKTAVKHGAKVGSGKRFRALAKDTSPALAAWRGRKKYGKKGFAALSKKGRKKRGRKG